MASGTSSRISRAYYLLALALFLQSTSAGLIQMAVYGELAAAAGNKIFFGLVFAASIVPSLVLGIYADRLFALYGAITVLLGTIATLLASVLTVLMFKQGENLYALITLDVITAAAAAMTVPLFQFATKSVTTHNFSLQRALRIETFILSGSVIFGVGLGALFFNTLGTSFYLNIVTVLFFASLLFIAVSSKQGDALYKYQSLGGGDMRKGLALTFAALKEDGGKRDTFIFLPSLALFTVPLIAALPAIDGVQRDATLLMGILIPLPLMLLFMRALGQLMGPLLVNQKVLDFLARESGAVIFLMGLFLALYIVAFVSGLGWLACLAIFTAHLCTNMLWAKNYCDMQVKFSHAEIGLVSATQAQLAQIAMIIASLIGTAILEEYGILGLLLACGISSLVPIMTSLRR